MKKYLSGANKVFAIALVACMGLVGQNASAQQNRHKGILEAGRNHVNKQNGGKSGSQYQKQGNKKEFLSMSMLKSATEIKYSFNNGSVHPDYQYQGYIVVDPHSVSLEIYHDGFSTYSYSTGLSTQEYNRFLDKLYSLGIINDPDADYLMYYGGGVYELEIYDGSKKVLEGTINETITSTKGSIHELFESMLTPEMLKVYKDPIETINNPHYIEIEDYDPTDPTDPNNPYYYHP